MQEKKFVSAELKSYRRVDGSLDASLQSLEFLMHVFLDRICEIDNDPSHTSQYMAMFLHKILTSNNKDDVIFGSATTDSETLAVMLSDLKILPIAHSLYSLNENDWRCRYVMTEVHRACLGACISMASIYLEQTKQQLLLFNGKNSYDKDKKLQLEKECTEATNTFSEVNKFCEQFYLPKPKPR